MAKRKRRTHRKSQKTQAGTSRYLQTGMGLMLLGLLAFGAFSFSSTNQDVETSSSVAAVSLNDGNLEAISIEDGPNQKAIAAEPITDRETVYLGPASDPTTLALAETGELGQPTLVFFHADW